MTEPYRSSLSSFQPVGLVPDGNTDEARERAIRVLTDAFAYDVISDSEFERRLKMLGKAIGTAGIDAVVADLPREGSLAKRAPAYGSPVPSVGRISGLMSETRRTGPWRVPEHLTVRAIMCDMKLDLRYAALPAQCTIDVTAIMSAVVIIVSPGTLVDFNVDPIIGAAGSGADDFFRDPASAHLRVRGKAIIAEVRVKVGRHGR
ncbi:MAG: DUF1707 domain-containing protein [Gemmatimonadota bacterium]|nr:DUF1707 domain-containing protein [Gemmatimonadota bacterium]